MKITENQLRTIVRRILKEQSVTSIRVKSNTVSGEEMLDFFLDAGFKQAEWEGDEGYHEPKEPTDDEVEVVGDKEVFFDMLSDGTLEHVTYAVVGNAPINVNKYKQPHDKNWDDSLKQMTGLRGYDKYFSDKATAKNQFKVSAYNNSETMTTVQADMQEMKASIETHGFKVLSYDGAEYNEYVNFIVQGDAQAFIKAVQNGKIPTDVADIQLQYVYYIDKRNMQAQHKFRVAEFQGQRM